MLLPKKILYIGRLIFCKKKIVFLVQYPNEEELKDGYFQRVYSIDWVLSDYVRIYLDYNQFYNSILPKIDKIRDGAYKIIVKPHSIFHNSIIFIVTIFSGRVYAHSILRLETRFNRFLFKCARKSILDIHGVVPEESEMCNNIEDSIKFNLIERYAVKNASVIIGVTRQMLKHFSTKYKIDKKKTILLPIIPKIRNRDGSIKKNNSNFVVYCGGIHPWQQPKKMYHFVNENKNRYIFTFLTPNPQKLLDDYQNECGENFPGITYSANSDEVKRVYAKNAFGLVLREDNIVNRVACPTKLVEYLQNDIVPIVDFEEIGDFMYYKYKFVKYMEDLPSKKEWEKMILYNRGVYQRVYKDYKIGMQLLINKLF